jgi:hypothetical protein
MKFISGGASYTSTTSESEGGAALPRRPADQQVSPTESIEMESRTSTVRIIGKPTTPNEASTLGASQFLAELFFSLAPGFSRVNRARRKWKRFQPFSAPAATKPLKRLGAASPAPTGLKPGANERLQESEMRPRSPG